MKKHTKAAETFSVGEFIQDELNERGWNNSDLAKFMGRELHEVDDMVAGRKKITASTAIRLAAAFGTSAELWLNLQKR